MQRGGLNDDGKVGGNFSPDQIRQQETARLKRLAQGAECDDDWAATIRAELAARAKIQSR